MAASFKIATFNVNSISIRAAQVLEIMRQYDLDVLALQETKTPDAQFPLDYFHQAGYHVLLNGQKAYNGTAFISKEPLHYQCHRLPSLLSDYQQRFLVARWQDVTVVNCYVPNGGELESDKYQYKLIWLAALKDYLKRFDFSHDKVLVLGDFNIAPQDLDIYDPSVFQGQTLCSEPERQALQSIMQLGLRDIWRQYSPNKQAFSWWDYRQNSFTKNWGLRIDLLLSSEALSTHCTQCQIEALPRTWDRPSDHTPVVGHFSF